MNNSCTLYGGASRLICGLFYRLWHIKLHSGLAISYLGRWKILSRRLYKNVVSWPWIKWDCLKIGQLCIIKWPHAFKLSLGSIHLGWHSQNTSSPEYWRSKFFMGISELRIQRIKILWIPTLVNTRYLKFWAWLSKTINTVNLAQNCDPTCWYEINCIIFINIIWAMKMIIYSALLFMKVYYCGEIKNERRKRRNNNIDKKWYWCVCTIWLQYIIIIVIE